MIIDPSGSESFSCPRWPLSKTEALRQQILWRTAKGGWRDFNGRKSCDMSTAVGSEEVKHRQSSPRQRGPDPCFSESSLVVDGGVLGTASKRWQGCASRPLLQSCPTTLLHCRSSQKSRDLCSPQNEIRPVIRLTEHRNYPHRPLILQVARFPTVNYKLVSTACPLVTRHHSAGSSEYICTFMLSCCQQESRT